MNHPEPVQADQVYRFLTELLPKVRQLDDPQTTREFEHAMLHFAPPITSEFLGKSMDVLRKIAVGGGAVLSSSEIQKAVAMADAIQQQWFTGT